LWLRAFGAVCLAMAKRAFGEDELEDKDPSKKARVALCEPEQTTSPSAVAVDDAELSPEELRAARNRGYWHDFSNIERKMKEFFENNKGKVDPTKMPTQTELRQGGASGSLKDAFRLHGGTAAVAERLGLFTSAKPRSESQRRPRGYWQNFDNVQKETRELMANQGILGRLPTFKEMKASGNLALSHAFSIHGGIQVVAERMGLLSVKMFSRLPTEGGDQDPMMVGQKPKPIMTAVQAQPSNRLQWQGPEPRVPQSMTSQSKVDGIRDRVDPRGQWNVQGMLAAPSDVQGPWHNFRAAQPDVRQFWNDVSAPPQANQRSWPIHGHEAVPGSIAWRMQPKAPSSDTYYREGRSVMSVGSLLDGSRGPEVNKPWQWV